MPLSPEDVSRIAHLARLELSPAEGSAMQTQLNDFFKIVEQMSAVDTSGLEPLHTPLSAIGNVELRLRPDAVTETNHREANMANAPVGRGRPVPGAQGDRMSAELHTLGVAEARPRWPRRAPPASR
jgi:aspartyl-tRNA(Asn)/glutamyl-tRNA(Gln) amidotransferase subunit C